MQWFGPDLRINKKKFEFSRIISDSHSQVGTCSFQLKCMKRKYSQSSSAAFEEFKPQGGIQIFVSLGELVTT